ncbi:hypothetical protein ACFYO1_01070 [Nocardia sp. NPDC006044]|uniref:hypothetical protein n=1 Tax=Nocardia sp. NPDC006044 TaxID=3364306 RepID=UPI0036B6E712
MKIRSSVLITTGLSVLFLSSIASPCTAHAGNDDAEKKQYEEATDIWAALTSAFCDGAINPSKSEADRQAAEKQFNDAAIKEYDAAYRITPLQYSGGDPVDAARDATMRVITIRRTVGDREHRSTKEYQADFSVPSGFSESDKLRYWRYLSCGVADYKTEYRNALKTYTEKYGTRLKPGYDNDPAIIVLYDTKMVGMLNAVHDAGLLGDDDFEKYKQQSDELAKEHKEEANSG